MKNIALEHGQGLQMNLDKLTKGAESEDIWIDIFCESMVDYLQKLDNAAKGRYELDDYDLQVINIAMDQFALALAGNRKWNTI